MKVLDIKILTRFLRLAGDELTGDWVVIGGVVLPLLGIQLRVTNDIDIAGPRDAGNEQTLVLMEIARRLGLPVETINQSGAYFLYRIKGWKKSLVPLHHGKSATIHRPDVTLFILLKLTRFSESDLTDCLEMLKFARRRNERPDVARIRKAVRKLFRQNPSEMKEVRLNALLDALTA